MNKQDHAAIQAVLAGDRDAYAALVMRYSAMLFRVAFRITANEADADDVVQEAFLRGYRRLETFAARSDFGTWIYRITVHCALDKIKGRRGNEHVSITESGNPEQEAQQVADSAADPERLFLSSEMSVLQNSALHSLTPAERTAFVLRHLEDCTTEEIATAMGISTNTAKQSVFRAVQKLRLRLAALRVNI
jgi:RNA polymerase sigma-70 factor (ECF subfamily)